MVTSDEGTLGYLGTLVPALAKEPPLGQGITLSGQINPTGLGPLPRTLILRTSKPKAGYNQLKSTAASVGQRLDMRYRTNKHANKPAKPSQAQPNQPTHHCKNNHKHTPWPAHPHSIQRCNPPRWVPALWVEVRHAQAKPSVHLH